MAQQRDQIPLGIKRTVRQQCFFGCAVCGSPVFQYDHIDDYAQVREHAVENLILLCRNCHGEKTSKRLDIERVREARQNPFNLNRLRTPGYQLQPNRRLSVEVGTNIVNDPMFYDEMFHVLWADGNSLFTIHKIGDWLTFSMLLTDMNGNPLVQINEGELILSTEVFDYTYEGKQLIIRNQPRGIVIDLELTNYEVKVNKGLFYKINLDGFKVDNTKVTPVIGGASKGVSYARNVSERTFGAVGIFNRNISDGRPLPTGFAHLYVEPLNRHNE